MNTAPDPESPFYTEQEAAVAILFSCLQHGGRAVESRHLEHLSRMLLLCEKFKHLALPPLAEKALPLIKHFGSRAVLEHSAPLVSEAFRETLFAMVCELMTADGELTEAESEIVGLAALYMGVSIELMRVMLTTFLIRNRWNTA